MSRRVKGLAALLAVAAVAVAGLGFAAVRLGGSSTPSQPPLVEGPIPHFVEETASAGVAETYTGDAKFSTGGGVAVFDCNGDRKPDLFVAGGSVQAALFENESPAGGALRFSRVTSPVTDLTGVTGAYPIDIDGDGNVDLAVLRLGETELLRGLGGCRFEPANATWGFDAGTGLATAFSATWEGSNSLPTLAVGRYLKLDAKGDTTFDCDASALFRPAGAGGAAAAPHYAAPIPLTPGYCTLSVLFSDWDRSGRRDLRMTNDRHYYATGEDQLWRVAPGEAPRQYTTDDGWIPLQIWGMGIASYDLSGSGYPDVFLTSQGDNKLQTLRAGASQPAYRDVAGKHGVTLTRPFTGGDIMPSTAWHPEFQDVNNDGFVDLFVSKGSLGEGVTDYALKDPSDLMLGGPGGAFTEVADKAGILSFDRGRGAALADFNLDGMLDLVEVNYGSPVRIWRNVGAGTDSRPAQPGNWVGISVSEPGPNRDAIGSWVEVKVGDRTERRELTIGGGHAGGQLGPVHFGLGQAASAQVRVVWPDGEKGQWMSVAANEYVSVARGARAPTRLP